MNVDRRFIFSDIPEHLQMPVGLLSQLHKSGLAHFGFARIRGYQPELRDLGAVLIGSTGDSIASLIAPMQPDAIGSRSGWTAREIRSTGVWIVKAIAPTGVWTGAAQRSTDVTIVAVSASTTVYKIVWV